MARLYIPYEGPIVTRNEAIASGSKLYFTGKPCKKKHIQQRRVATCKCVDCEYLASAKWQSANADVVNAKWRRYHARQRKKLNAARAARRALDIEKTRAEWRRAYELNPERHRENSRRHRAKHPEKSVEYRRNRHARKKGAAGKHTAAQVRALLPKQQFRCANCRVNIRSGYHVDHIVPLARGGSNDIRNIQLLCARCNLRKRDKDPIDWARQQGKLL